MFYETKVLDCYGKLIKIISTEELHSRHWKNFKFMEEKGRFFKKKILKNRKERISKNPLSENEGDDY